MIPTTAPSSHPSLGPGLSAAIRTTIDEEKYSNVAPRTWMGNTYMKKPPGDLRKADAGRYRKEKQVFKDQRVAKYRDRLLEEFMKSNPDIRTVRICLAKLRARGKGQKISMFRGVPGNTADRNRLLSQYKTMEAGFQFILGAHTWSSKERALLGRMQAGCHAALASLEGNDAPGGRWDSRIPHDSSSASSEAGEAAAARPQEGANKQPLAETFLAAMEGNAAPSVGISGDGAGGTILVREGAQVRFAVKCQPPQKALQAEFIGGLCRNIVPRCKGEFPFGLPDQTAVTLQKDGRASQALVRALEQKIRDTRVNNYRAEVKRLELDNNQGALKSLPFPKLNPDMPCRYDDPASRKWGQELERLKAGATVMVQSGVPGAPLSQAPDKMERAKDPATWRKLGFALPTLSLLGFGDHADPAVTNFTNLMAGADGMHLVDYEMSNRRLAPPAQNLVRDLKALAAQYLDTGDKDAARKRMTELDSFKDFWAQSLRPGSLATGSLFSKEEAGAIGNADVQAFKEAAFAGFLPGVLDGIDFVRENRHVFARAYSDAQEQFGPRIADADRPTFADFTPDTLYEIAAAFDALSPKEIAALRKLAA